MKNGIYRHTEETKQRMRAAHKGKTIPLAQRRKISASRLARRDRMGFLNSPDTRRKLSEGRRGEKNWNFGKPRPALAYKKAGEASRRRIGWHHTPETRARMALSRTGARNPSWKGGITTPERLRFFNRRRKVQKRTNGGSHSFGEWQTLKAQFNFTCPDCKRSEPTITLTEDHIIPVSKGGSDNIENIQPLCGSCNSKKYTKTIRFSPSS